MLASGQQTSGSGIKVQLATTVSGFFKYIGDLGGEMEKLIIFFETGRVVGFPFIQNGTVDQCPVKRAGIEPLVNLLADTSPARVDIFIFQRSEITY